MQIGVNMSTSKKGVVSPNVVFIMNRKEFVHMGEPEYMFAVEDNGNIFFRNSAQNWFDVDPGDAALVSRRKVARTPIEMQTYSFRLRNVVLKNVDPLKTWTQRCCNQIDIRTETIVESGLPVQIRSSRVDIANTITNAPEYRPRYENGKAAPKKAAPTATSGAPFIPPEEIDEVASDSFLVLAGEIPVEELKATMSDLVVRTVNASQNPNQCIAGILKGLNALRHKDENLVYSGENGNVIAETKATVTLI